jgi:hypothetical protein
MPEKNPRRVHSANEPLVQGPDLVALVIGVGVEEVRPLVRMAGEEGQLKR